MDAVHIEAKEALTTLLKHLNRFYTVLTKHGMDPDIIAQIFKQVCNDIQNHGCIRVRLRHFYHLLRCIPDILLYLCWIPEQPSSSERHVPLVPWHADSLQSSADRTVGEGQEDPRRADTGHWCIHAADSSSSVVASMYLYPYWLKVKMSWSILESTYHWDSSPLINSNFLLLRILGS